MTALKYTVDLLPGQTVASFLSNLAAYNGAPNMYSFCSHMGLTRAQATYSSRSVLSSDYLNLERISDLSNANPDNLARSVVKRIDKHWASIAGQRIRHKDIAYENFRHCPACLNEDFSSGRGPDELRTTARLWWLVKTIDSCPVHNVQLVSSKRAYDRLLNGDFAHYLRSNRDEVAAFYNEREVSPQSPVDGYQLHRLRGECVSPFLDSLPFFGAIELCEVVGGLDLCGSHIFRRDIVTAERVREARGRGFAILDPGVEGLNELIHRNFRNVWTGHRAVSRDIYGSLYVWLSGKARDPEFKPVRDVVEAHARANLPLGPGDKFFFRTPKRHRHSVQTLAKQFSIHYTRIEKMLIEGRFTTASELKNTESRVLFDAKRVEQFVAGFDETCDPAVAGNLLQVDDYSLNSLSAVGCFETRRLRNGDGSTKLRFVREEVEAFQKRVIRNAGYCANPGEQWLDVRQVAKECSCSMLDVFRLLNAERLKSLVYTGGPTFGNLRMDAVEVRQTLKQKLHVFEENISQAAE